MFQWRDKLADNQRGKRYVGVLLAIARYADNDTGIAWPKRTWLCEATGLSPAALKRHLREAEADGWVKRIENGKLGRATTYVCRLPVWAEVSPAPRDRCAITDDSRDAHDALTETLRRTGEELPRNSEESQRNSALGAAPEFGMPSQGFSSEPLGDHYRASKGVSSEPPTTHTTTQPSTHTGSGSSLRADRASTPVASDRDRGEPTGTPRPLPSTFAGNASTHKQVRQLGLDHDTMVRAFHAWIAEHPESSSNWGGLFTRWAYVAAGDVHPGYDPEDSRRWANTGDDPSDYYADLADEQLNPTTAPEKPRDVPAHTGTREPVETPLAASTAPARRSPESQPDIVAPTMKFMPTDACFHHNPFPDLDCLACAKMAATCA